MHGSPPSCPVSPGLAQGPPGQAEGTTGSFPGPLSLSRRRRLTRTEPGLGRINATTPQALHTPNLLCSRSGQQGLGSRQHRGPLCDTSLIGSFRRPGAKAAGPRGQGPEAESPHPPRPAKKARGSLCALSPGLWSLLHPVRLPPEPSHRALGSCAGGARGGPAPPGWCGGRPVAVPDPTGTGRAGNRAGGSPEKPGGVALAGPVCCCRRMGKEAEPEDGPWGAHVGAFRARPEDWNVQLCLKRWPPSPSWWQLGRFR